MKKIFSLFLVALLLFAARPASATILFAGGEDIDFTPSGCGITTTTTAGKFNSTYSRLAIYPNIISVGSYWLLTPVFTNSSSFWIHFDHISTYSGGSTTNAADWVVIFDSSGVERIRIAAATNSTNPTVVLKKVNAAGTATTLATSTAAIAGSSLNTFDIYVDYSASGTLTFYQNGTQIVTYSGDVTTDGQTSLAKVGLTQIWDANNITYASMYSQVIVATTDTRSMKLATIQPVANGNVMQWTGAVSDVNETTLSDATAITSGTSDQLAQFTVPSLPSGTFGVEAIVQSVRASRGSTGPQNLQFVARTGGSDYTSSSQSLITSYQNYQYLWATNPATGSAWTTSEIAAAGFNLGIKSKP